MVRLTPLGCHLNKWDSFPNFGYTISLASPQETTLTDTPLTALSTSMRKLLRPLVRILLRHGVSYGQFSDWARQTFVEVARDDFAIQGRKQTVSRISVITGINRKEVKKLLETPEPNDDHQSRHNRAARVIGGWLRSRRFTDADGAPRRLRLDDAENGFAALVKAYSGDMPVRAVLDELERVGIVGKRDDGTLELLKRAYVPQASDADMLHLLGDSVADLADTIDHNLSHPGEDNRLQLSVVYDNLPRETLARLKTMSQREARKLLVEIDRFLASEDRDSSGKQAGEGRYRAGVGVYYFEQPYREDGPDHDESR